MHPRQRKQPSTNKETSDAVTCQSTKSVECMIGTSIKPAIKKTDYVKRNIVEFCCGENSKIGQSKYQRDGFSVTRVTLEDDVTTNQGLYKAIEAVRSDNCLLWASIPCTGGSPWRNINSKKLGGLERIRTQKIVQQSIGLIQNWQRHVTNMEVD